MARGHRVYSDQTRGETLELYRRVGLNEAERQSGVSKKTILVWAKAAGVSTEAVTEEVTETKRRAGRAAGARAAVKREERREKLIDHLGENAEMALLREKQVLHAGGFQTTDIAALSQARERSVKQFELLGGRPTERVELERESQTLLLVVVEAVKRSLSLIEDESLRDEVRREIAKQLHWVKMEMEEGSLVLEADDAEEAEYAELPAGEAAA